MRNNNLKIINRIKNLKKNKKKIVLCHGVFDLVHLGHIKHFKKAKAFGDYLIVSITKDEFINKGPGRPIFNHFQRIEYLKELQIIDDVFLSEGSSATDVIKKIKPDIYVKGAEYSIDSLDKTKKIIEEKSCLKKYGGKIKFTYEKTFSSSKIINQIGISLNEEQRIFINKIKKTINYIDFNKIFNDFKKLKVLVLGEIIIDQYCFGNGIGKSGKEPYLVFSEKFTENYLGGSAFVARNISPFVKKVNLFSPFGFEKNNKNILKKDSKKNIAYNLIKPYKNYPTIIKKRFVDKISNYKLFGSYTLPEVNVIKNNDVIIRKIKKLVKENDMIICCDYGHNFITDEIVEFLKKTKKRLFVNAQVNSSNFLYRSLNRYTNVDSIIINETELRQDLKDNSSDIYYLAKKLLKKNKLKNLIVTMGINGVILVNNKGEKFNCPAFSMKSKDKVGAGDAMLSIVSLGFKLNLKPELTLLLGSIAASMSVENIGNKESIDFYKFDRTIEYLLK